MCAFVDGQRSPTPAFELRFPRYAGRLSDKHPANMQNVFGWQQKPCKSCSHLNQEQCGYASRGTCSNTGTAEEQAYRKSAKIYGEGLLVAWSPSRLMSERMSGKHAKAHVHLILGAAQPLPVRSDRMWIRRGTDQHGNRFPTVGLLVTRYFRRVVCRSTG